MTASHTPVIGRAGSNGKYQLSWCQGWPHAPGFLKMNCERKQSSCGPDEVGDTVEHVGAARERLEHAAPVELEHLRRQLLGCAVAPDEVRLGQHERLGLGRAVGLRSGHRDDVVEHRLARCRVGEAGQPHEPVLVEVLALGLREGAHRHQRSTYWSDARNAPVRPTRPPAGAPSPSSATPTPARRPSRRSSSSTAARCSRPGR